MKKIRQNTGGRRVVIGVIALYAFLLQAFFASATPLPAIDSSPGAFCAQSSGPTSGEDGRHGHLGLCCIVACSSAVSVYLDAVAGVAYFPQRTPSPFVFAAAPPFAIRTAFGFHFAARGPPSDL